jgi:glycosyltransferase involved in cell wall biosynthesis
MKVHANVQVKNESILLEEVIPEWMEYPIDTFVFYDDNSTDDTIVAIQDQCDAGRYEIILGSLRGKADFNEAANRSAMLEYSRADDADVVISLDADELLSDPFVDNFDYIMKKVVHANRDYNVCGAKVYTFQWNVAGSMSYYRSDPAYFKNYRDFIFPMKCTGKYDMSLTRYHSPRTPPINTAISHQLPDKYGFVHLQSLNVRFYALKQLWYKTYEYVNYGKSVADINAAYDPVVNGLDFNPLPMPSDIIGWDTIDPKIFDKIAEQRGYKDYILENSVPELITFGEEYLND